MANNMPTVLYQAVESTTLPCIPVWGFVCPYHGMANQNQDGAKLGGYPALLANGSFQAFLWTQFLGAFNDNVYKMIVSVGAVELAANRLLGARYLALAGAVFVLPFLFFAGDAGQIAHRLSETRALPFSKAFEIVILH